MVLNSNIFRNFAHQWVSLNKRYGHFLNNDAPVQDEELRHIFIYNDPIISELASSTTEVSREAR